MHGAERNDGHSRVTLAPDPTCCVHSEVVCSGRRRRRAPDEVGVGRLVLGRARSGLSVRITDGQVNDPYVTTPLVRSVSWLLSERTVKLGVALIATAWVARYLGPERYGELAYAVSLTLIFSELATLGLNALLTRELVHDRSREGDLLGSALALRAISGVLAALMAILVAWFATGGSRGVVALVAILSVGFLFKVGEVFEHYFHAREQMRVPSRARIGASVVHLLTSVGLVAARAGVGAFAVARVVEVVVMNARFAAAYFSQSNRAVLRFRRDVAQRLLSTSWPLVLSGIGATMNLKVDQVMLGILSGDAAVGRYAVAAQLSEAWYFVPTALMAAFLPGLVHLRRNDHERYVARYRDLIDAMFWLGVGVAAVITVVAPWLVPFVFGEAYRPAVAIIAIHVWGGVFVAMRAVLSKWIVTEGFSTISLQTHGTGAVLNVLANLVLIPAYGPIGAAVATVISYAGASVIPLVFVKRARPILVMMLTAWTAPLRWFGRWRH